MPLEHQELPVDRPMHAAGGGLSVRGKATPAVSPFAPRTPHLGHSMIRVQSWGVSRLPSESASDLGIWTDRMGTTAPQPPQRVVLEVLSISLVPRWGLDPD